MLFSSVLFCCTVLVLATEATQEKEAEQRYWDIIKKDVERDLNTEKAERNFWEIPKFRTARNLWKSSPEERKRDLENETNGPQSPMDDRDLGGWIVVPYSITRKRDIKREAERSPFDITNNVFENTATHDVATAEKTKKQLTTFFLNGAICMKVYRNKNLIERTGSCAAYGAVLVRGQGDIETDFRLPFTCFKGVISSLFVTNRVSDLVSGETTICPYHRN